MSSSGKQLDSCQLLAELNFFQFLKETELRTPPPRLLPLSEALIGLGGREGDRERARVGKRDAGLECELREPGAREEAQPESGGRGRHSARGPGAHGPGDPPAPSRPHTPPPRPGARPASTPRGDHYISPRPAAPSPAAEGGPEPSPGGAGAPGTRPSGWGSAAAAAVVSPPRVKRAAAAAAASAARGEARLARPPERGLLGGLGVSAGRAARPGPAPLGPRRRRAPRPGVPQLRVPAGRPPRDEEDSAEEEEADGGGGAPADLGWAGAGRGGLGTAPLEPRVPGDSPQRTRSRSVLPSPLLRAWPGPVPSPFAPTFSTEIASLSRPPPPGEEKKELPPPLSVSTETP
ncbi:translation initiation factor IF-2-like [Perognathus longimembris pacificus]|uniref:translation initiation factor IF-2-like n=1 Tax=Perognathus longimembris pacificus TaxID=214514 RepID=UPI00201948FA|nr:translation initiation factor IF-2-like [Perognathus longimembris pacificus]